MSLVADRQHYHHQLLNKLRHSAWAVKCSPLSNGPSPTCLSLPLPPTVSAMNSMSSATVLSRGTTTAGQRPSRSVAPLWYHDLVNEWTAQRSAVACSIRAELRRKNSAPCNRAVKNSGRRAQSRRDMDRFRPLVIVLILVLWWCASPK